MKLFNFESKEEWLKLRLDDITSTECSALFDLNPYMTYFELWHQKKNKETIILEDNERLFWGNILEPAIAEGVATKQGWEAEPFKQYARHEDLRAGSSFDFKIKTDEGEGLLEIKNVDFLQIKNKWVVEDGRVIEAPPHIEIQVQHQLMITGLPFCYIAALQGGNKVHLIKRTPQPGIIEAIKSKIIKFWDSIEGGIEPQPNFETDADFISKLHGYAEPGKVMDVTPEHLDELAKIYSEAAKDEREAAKKKKAAKAEMLTLIGESEKVLGGNYTISAGMIGPASVSYEREGYRNFKVYMKKEKSK